MQGDPVNFNDPLGLFTVSVGGQTWSGTDAGECKQWVLGLYSSSEYPANLGSAGVQAAQYACVMAALYTPVAVTGPSAPAPPCPVTLGAADDYVCLQTSGSKWNAVAATARSVVVALANDPTCENWLASTIGMAALQATYLSNLPSYYAVADSFIIHSNGAPATQDDATQGDVPGYNVIINYSLFATRSADYNRDTILHELAHMVSARGFIQDDGGSDRAEKHNEKLLTKNCSKTINGGN